MFQPSGHTLSLPDACPISTLNDVVLPTVGGALGKYLAKHKELPKDSLVAVAPINLRGKGGKAATPGNQVSAMSVPVRTDLAGPLERLAAIRDYTVEAKEAKAGVSARIMTDLSQHIPGARSEEHTSELQSLMRIPYAVFCLKK